MGPLIIGGKQKTGTDISVKTKFQRIEIAISLRAVIGECGETRIRSLASRWIHSVCNHIAPKMRTYAADIGHVYGGILRDLLLNTHSPFIDRHVFAITVLCGIARTVGSRTKI